MNLKEEIVQRLQDQAPDGQTVVRGTVIWGKPYYWAVDRKGIYHLNRWPEEVSL